MSELASLQSAFYAYVTAGEPVGDMIATGDPTIYARMYASRLHDALAEDCPKLRAALGHDAFAAMAYRYFRDRPPRSFSLRDAGLELSAYLRNTATEPAQDPTWSEPSEPADAGERGPDMERTSGRSERGPDMERTSGRSERGPDMERTSGRSERGPWLSEMAALERARVEVFDGCDAAVLDQDQVAALGDALPNFVLRWVPASRLVHLMWNVDDMWSATEDGIDAVTPCLVEVSRAVLVWRRDNIVVHRTLEDDEAVIAPQLIGGSSFADVCEVLAAFHGENAAPRAVELLLRWLQAMTLAQVNVADE